MAWILIYVELRKSVNTRAARGLLITLLVLGAGCAIVTSGSSPTLNVFVSAAVLPLPLLLPILAILAVTGDWTQRAAVTTFALVPRRGRVLAARAAAAVILVFGTMLTIATVTAIVFVAIHSAELPMTDWPDLRRTLWSITAISLAAALSGVAMGSLILNTPVAIVVTMFLPIAYELFIATRFAEVATWVSSLAFSQWLSQPQWTWIAQHENTIGLGPALCSLALWTVVPLALGWVRQLRKEVK